MYRIQNYKINDKIGENSKLDKLIKRHCESESKRKAIFNIIPGASYLQAKEHFSIKNKNNNSPKEEDNLIV